MLNTALVLLLAYALVLLLLSFSGGETSPAQFLLAGRKLSLPALVLTLVTTWYGGILGIGEYTWRHGISTWLVFGVPYYLAAILFALFLQSSRVLPCSSPMSQHVCLWHCMRHLFFFQTT